MPTWIHGGLDGQRREQLAGEIRDELEAHVDELRAALVRAGWSPDDAGAEALRRFGDPETHLEACLEERLKEPSIMQTALTALLAIVATSLAFTLAQAHEMRGEIDELRAQMAGLAPAPAERHVEPRPVVFGIGDRLLVQDSLNPELTARPTIAADGRVLLPEIGWVTAYGKERGEFEAELRELYSQYFVDSLVYVALADDLGVPPSTDR